MKLRKFLVLIAGAGLLLHGAGASAETYYVNDADQTGDVYTTAKGSDDEAITGKSPEAPVATLTNLLSKYTLTAGDTVYIDTGTYSNKPVLNVTATAEQPLCIIGSTNGTLFQTVGNCVELQGEYFLFRHLQWRVAAWNGSCIYGKAGFSNTTFECCSFSHATRGAAVLVRGQSASAALTFRHCFFQENWPSIFDGTFRELTLEHCVFRLNNPNNLCTLLGPWGSFEGPTVVRACIFLDGGLGPVTSGDGDWSYNLFYGITEIGGTYETVEAIQTRLATWHHNATVSDIGFVSLKEKEEDYHLEPWSPGIDAGPPSDSAWTNEPPPNGGRVNIGLYGGSGEAVKSPTGPWVRALAYDGGGMLVGTGTLVWASGNLGDEAKVDLEYCTNKTDWVVIAKDIPAADGTYTWAPSIDAPAVWWRVKSATNSAVASTNSAAFGIKTSLDVGFTYYVNDDALTGDVWCTAVGDDTADGTTPATPKRNLKEVVDAYILGGGDQVRVDTGVYQTNATTILSALDSGREGAPLLIVGSPNGGTCLDRMQTRGEVICVQGDHVTFSNINVKGGFTGYWVKEATGVRILRSHASGYGNVGTGILLEGAVQTEIMNCAMTGTTFGVDSKSGGRSNVVRNCVFHGNTVHLKNGVGLSVRNSIFSGGGTALKVGLSGDYNILGPDVTLSSDASYPYFASLANAGFGWTHCLKADPGFVDAGAGNFHLVGTNGYWGSGGTWGEGGERQSPAIDFGDPSDAVGAEPEPNGGRINAGMYGGTAQATKSAEGAWLQVLSFTDGEVLNGNADGTAYWTGGNLPEGATVAIYLSKDAGASWTLVTNGLSAADGAWTYTADSWPYGSSRIAKWKIVLEGSAVSSETAGTFTYRQGPFTYYVNDRSREGDVYCSAIGDDTNSGTGPDVPKATLSALVAAYPPATWEAGDEIYVDTGVYAGGGRSPIVIAGVAGSNDAPVRIFGSTNRLAGGSLLKSTLVLTNCNHLLLSDIFANGEQIGVRVSMCENLQLQRVEAIINTVGGFVVGEGSQSIVFRHCVAHGNAIGLQVQLATNVMVQHSLFWDNCATAVALLNRGAVTVKNSILGSTRDGAALFSVTNATLISDYNGLYVGANTLVGRWTDGTAAENLRRWQLASGLDAHSVPGDPLLADADGYDYHLKTTATRGRWDPSAGFWTTDTEKSPLLDAGDPGDEATREPGANGGRVNIGVFGDTAEASQAPTTPWLTPITFVDAGSVVSNGAVCLSWLSGTNLTGTVAVDVSLDGGKTWKEIATNIVGNLGAVTWEVDDTYADTPAGLWRVRSENDPAISGATETFFALRRSPLVLYINNYDTNETLYTTAAGSADNWTATASAPLDSLARAFARFDLEGGDTLYVDTGVYQESDAIRIDLKHSGTADNPVHVVGATNDPYGGAIIARRNRKRGNYAFDLRHGKGVEISCLTVSNAHVGIYAADCSDIGISTVRVTHVVENGVFGERGTTNLVLRNCILEDSEAFGLSVTGSVVEVHNSLFQGNRQAAVSVSYAAPNPKLTITDSILTADESGRYIYCFTHEAATNVLVSDHNDLRATNGGCVGQLMGVGNYRFLYDWQQAFGQDAHSFGFDPLFYDAAAADYHLLSEHGRYANGEWATNDVATSKLIDLGSSSDTRDETAPHGNRLNVGLYGGTAEASRSPTEGRALVPLTMSDGGVIRGEVTLKWAYNGISGDSYVNVLVSTDGGETWTKIGRERVSYTDGVVWSTTNTNSTAMAVWKVELEDEPEIHGETETYFSIKNEPLHYYVNDGSTNGDMYCTAAGSALGSGISPDQPLNSLPALFKKHQVDPGDTIYIDTGVYECQAPVSITQPDRAATNRLVIQGSTAEAYGGSVFTNTADFGAGLVFTNATHVELRDVTVCGGTRGIVFIGDSCANRLFHVRVAEVSQCCFDLKQRSGENEFVQCAALDFMRTGLSMATPMPRVSPVTNCWVGGVMISAGATNACALDVMTGRLSVTNSVFVLKGAKDVVFTTVPSVIDSDYNCFHRAQEGAQIARYLYNNPYGRARVDYASLADWRAVHDGDVHSFEADPLFVDASGWDLHPMSRGGHYNAGDFSADEVTSPLIDTGTGDVSEETAPNGGRRNIGFYGGTVEASRSPTNSGSFVLLTFADGGVLKTATDLRWQACGAAASYDQFVEISLDGGGTWPISETNTTESYRWNVSGLEPSPHVMWRVRSARPDLVTTAESGCFLLHTGPISYYVNDAFTDGDVYCSAGGRAGNTGLSPDSPLLSLSELFDRYDLEAGDVIYMDTGVYGNPAPIAWGHNDGGTAEEPVVLRGSTNLSEGGTCLTSNGLVVDENRGISLRDLRFSKQVRARAGLHIARVEDIHVAGVEITGGLGDGLEAVRCSNIWVETSLFANNVSNGLKFAGCYNANADRITVWSNVKAQVAMQADPVISSPKVHIYATVSNSILGSFGTRIPAYSINACELTSDYNDFLVDDGGLVALRIHSPLDMEYDSVTRWQTASGNDVHSLSHDPLFANVRGLDFHLRSAAGRMEGGVWVTNDTVTSPLLDAGDPARGAWEGEPAPNGGRLNLGRYAGTWQASKTPSDSSVTLISLNDGGRVSGNVDVYWLANGAITNGNVVIQFSEDGGQTWEAVGTNAAAAGVFQWDTHLFQTVEGKIRVVSETDPNISATSEKVFAVRNYPIVFYINDDSTDGDVYCTAIGNATNTGLSADAPMDDLNRLLDKYDLEAGDKVQIDTGVYRLSDLNPWRIGQADSAYGAYEEDGPVVYQGSTNKAAGGSLLDARGGAAALLLHGVQGVVCRDLICSNALAGNAVFVTNGYDINLEWMQAVASSNAYTFAAGSNICLSHASAIQIDSGISIAADAMSISNCVIWKPTTGVALALQGQKRAVVKDSVFAIASGCYAYKFGKEDKLESDYNAFLLEPDARVVMQNISTTKQVLVYETVGTWASVSGNDQHSHSGANLCMVDPDHGDFHLRSTKGRCLADGSWVCDEENSPLIDGGDPDETAGDEPAPNGGRRNIGLYGGSIHASKTPETPQLIPLSLSRGGVASGRVVFSWRAVGAALTNTVAVDVSTNNGATWISVAKGVPASDGEVSWNSGDYAAPLCRWRVYGESDPALFAQSEENFILHNGPICYYVNDDSTHGDVYCSAVGDGTADGVSPATPKNSIQSILDTYNLEPGDVVYIDTGDYLLDAPVILGSLDGGEPEQLPSRQVTLCGSTNLADGGTVLMRADGEGSLILASNVLGVRFVSLSLAHARIGLQLVNAYFCSGEWLRISGCEDGVSVVNGDEISFSHTACFGNSRAGVRFQSPMSFYLKVDPVQGPKLYFDSGILWSNRYGLYIERGIGFASNSIMGIVTPHAYGYYGRSDLDPMVYSGDYNNLYVCGDQAAAAGLQLKPDESPSVRTTRYDTVSRLVAMRGHDAHSLAHDPLLADVGAGDFHLSSTMGRHEKGKWVRDTVYSPVIDAGDPARTEWAEETTPNGRRMNIGLYGGTKEASRSELRGSIVILTLNDGGTANGTVALSWSARGEATNEMVCLRYSPDAGLTWSNIACGVEASRGTYLWDSIPYGRSARALWEIYCEDYPEIGAQSMQTFTLRNGGEIPYYVNDDTVEEGGYCTAPGSAENDGLTPGTPLNSVQSVLDLYDLDPADVIYVDGGTYSVGAPALHIGAEDSGWYDPGTHTAMYVTIQGQTNPATPTIFQAPSATVPHVIDMSYSEYFRLRDIILRGGSVGINTAHTISNRFERLRLEGMRGIGISMSHTIDAWLDGVVIWNARSNAVTAHLSSMDIVNSVLWGATNALSIDAGVSHIGVTNSVLQASGPNARVYLGTHSVHVASVYQGDYNNFWCENSAVICEQQALSGGSELHGALNEWNLATGMDAHSMTLDPLFADSGAGDFHPCSEEGRYCLTDVGGVNRGVWTNDYAGVRSPLIDAGSLRSAYSNEPAPNGDTINIGAYGNTPFASKTPTNTPWIQTISYNAGEVVAGTVTLYWIYGGLSPNEPVCVSYSTDGGVTWMELGTCAVGKREFVWNTSAIRLVPKFHWRVQQISNEEVADISDAACSIKNGTFTYYVNDADDTDDIFCSNIGTSYPLAKGTNSSSPVLTIQDVLDHYPIGLGDTIYIDTGTYEQGFVLGAANVGADGFPLFIVGSTNGTLFDIATNQNALVLQNTRHINVSNIMVRGGIHAFSLANVSNIRLDGIVGTAAASNGVYIANGADVFVKHALLYGNGAFGYSTIANIVGTRALDFVTLYGNRRGGCYNGDAQLVTVSNSILCVKDAPAIYLQGKTAVISGDNNLFCLEGADACLATNSNLRMEYESLSAWQAGGKDLRSTITDDVGFVDPAHGDFHLRSQTGSWHDGVWEADDRTSWAIDFGDVENPDYVNEPTPHGYRVNVGAYGGTAQASKSHAGSPALQVMTLADGGIATNGIALHWLSRGIDATRRVKISYWNGSTWVLLATPTAGSSPYIWNSTDAPTPEAYWRIELDGDPTVVSTSAMFSHRPSPITYYVNDDSTEGDVYCSACGARTNLGYRADSPLDGIQAVLDRFQLVGGDIVLVDTGDYLLDAPVILTATHSGSSADEEGMVLIQGSTNVAAGGSHLVGDGTFPGIDIAYGVTYVQLSDLCLDSFLTGINVSRSTYRLVFSNLDIANAKGNGVFVEQGRHIDFRHVLIRQAASNAVQLVRSEHIRVDGSVFWGSGEAAVMIDNSQLFATNTVFESFGENNFCYCLSSTNLTVAADYNAHYIHGGANAAKVAGVEYESVPQWVRFSRQDAHSLSGDPLFADAGAGDFHLKSVAGRYCAVSNVWLVDEEQSPLIDAGYWTNNNYANEPEPNGGRINIGLYGNTWQASKSDTNAWVRAITGMGGGILSGTFMLRWNYGGDLTGREMATLQYSADNGETWTLLGTTAVSNQVMLWNSEKLVGGFYQWPSSPGAMWNIVVGAASNSTSLFGLRNEPFKYYVNDASTEGDVWCAAVGDDANLGYWTNAPKRTLSNLLSSIDAEPGDILYLDTGCYDLAPNEVWPASDAGEAGNPLHVRGSKNGTCFQHTPQGRLGGTFTNNAGYLDMADIAFASTRSQPTLSVVFTGHGVHVRDVALTNAPLTIVGNGGLFERMKLTSGEVHVSGTNNVIKRMEEIGGGITFRGKGHELMQSLIYNKAANATGVLVRANGAVVSNCTVFMPKGSAVAMYDTAGRLTLKNNILVAGGSDKSCAIHWDAGSVVSDYNSLIARGKAWIGVRDGKKWERLAYWQAASGQDANSVSLEPAFVYEGEDFHLESTVGYWNRMLGKFEKGAVDSPLIDIGDVKSVYAGEVKPNGDRINLGAYGGTEEASLSRTNDAVTVLAPNDGGVVQGDGVVLRWSAPLTHTGRVVLEYWDGKKWVTIAEDVPATSGSYRWDTTGLNLFGVKWRVTDDAGNSDESDEAFDVRNATQDFFVNDETVTGDGYCTAAGHDANDGLTSGTPKATLQALLDAYDLEAGDTVYVDAGIYAPTGTTQIIWSRSGREGNPMVIQGHPNERATWLRQRESTNTILDVKASNIELRSLALGYHLAGDRGKRGILLDCDSNVVVQSMWVSNVQVGVEAKETVAPEIRNSAFYQTDTGILLNKTRDAVIANNTFVMHDRPDGSAAIDLKKTGEKGLVIENNIFDLGGEHVKAYAVNEEPSQLEGGPMTLVDYNLYSFRRDADQNAMAGFYEGCPVELAPTNIGLLLNWQLAMGSDFRSALADADLAETELVYALDFHPKSAYGRWGDGEWQLDGTTSFAVDHGDPHAAYENEPAENGSRINIGMYGNTAEASKGTAEASYSTRTLTDEDGALVVLQVGGTYVLVWDAHAVPTNETVTLAFYTGTLWTNLATGVNAYSEYVVQHMPASLMTAGGKWRVIAEEGGSELSGESGGNLVMRWADLGITNMPVVNNGRLRFNWVGGIGGREYWILYSDDQGKTWRKWSEQENGPAAINRSHFTLTTARILYTFEDRTSYQSQHRWYRIIETPIGGNVDVYISNPDD